MTVSTKTSNYTFQIGDANNWTRFNSSSPGAFTIDLNANVAFPIGTVLLMNQAGTGQLSLAAISGVTLVTSAPGLNTRARYAQVTATQLATDFWNIAGDLSA